VTIKYAGFWVRALAHLIDFVCWNLIELAIEYGIATPLHLTTVAQQILGVVVSLGVLYAYYVELPQRRGTTLGKEIFGIYVVDGRTGLNFSRKQALGRMFAYLLSYLIVGCGFLMAAFHPQKLGLHDLLAGTVSIRRKKTETIPVSDPKAHEKTDEAH
jgi:hypothetical protein